MILVTGAAGFIGAHLSKRLVETGHNVVGIDNLNDYYDVQLKQDRLKWFDDTHFIFQRINLEEADQVRSVFEKYNPKIVINLAAQAGVRYSLENPSAYVTSNIVGFTNILEACRHHKVDHLIYASSSSVYGANKSIPFSVKDNVDHPVSLYAATKKSNELMAHTYSHLFGLPTTGLRFFTVYGPWGRPDMAYFSFTQKILEGKPIQIFNHGQMRRDFTYIDDIVEGIIRLLNYPPKNKEEDSASSSTAPYKVYNIGNNQPVELMQFVGILEQHLGIKAVKELLPMQPGDVKETYADIKELQSDTGFSPATPLETGLKNFVDWYLAYYKLTDSVTGTKRVGPN
ncbi:NAD-dependent epimerase [Paenibacillus sp. 1P03SA]|uniref:NAD-dependent epimerase n=1 Tax=Paenibacillus sp. 1P03SA TaxID=3132294 RepID=UPI00399F6452